MKRLIKGSTESNGSLYKDAIKSGKSAWDFLSDYWDSIPRKDITDEKEIRDLDDKFKIEAKNIGYFIIENEEEDDLLAPETYPGYIDDNHIKQVVYKYVSGDMKGFYMSPVYWGEPFYGYSLKDLEKAIETPEDGFFYGKVIKYVPHPEFDWN